MNTAFSTAEHHMPETSSILEITDYSQSDLEYIYQCCCAISKTEAKVKMKNRIQANQELVAQYIKTNGCKRCGVWGLGLAKKHKFFEMHLPKLRRVGHLVKFVNPELLKIELERRDLFCSKCYPHIVREVTHNISAPPVKPFIGI